MECKPSRTDREFIETLNETQAVIGGVQLEQVAVTRVILD